MQKHQFRNQSLINAKKGVYRRPAEGGQGEFGGAQAGVGRQPDYPL